MLLCPSNKRIKRASKAHMKKFLFTILTVAAVLPVKAELFSPSSITGAAIGGIAGGIIGHNNGRHGAEGAAIGAGAGLLLGALADDNRSRHGGAYHGYYSSPSVGVSFYSGHHRPYYSGYYGSHHGHYSHYPRYYSSYYYAPRPYVVASAPVVEYVQQPVAVQQPAPQPVQQTTIINNYYNSSTPMSGANSLFGR